VKAVCCCPIQYRIFARSINWPQSSRRVHRSSTAVETKHPRCNETALLDISKHGNLQEGCVQRVGEFDTSNDNAAESNVQLCDKLSAAVNTSGSKIEPAAEMSPQATDNRVNLNNGSAQLAASSSSDLRVNSSSLISTAHCTSRKTTKKLSDRDIDGSANVLFQAERSQMQFRGRDLPVFGFGKSCFASTKFTVASVVLIPLQEGFKLTPCVPVLHALFKFVSVSVIVQLPHDRGICRYLFDRGKRSAVSCVCSFVQERAYNQKETATLHQSSAGKATAFPGSSHCVCFVPERRQTPVCSGATTLRGRRSQNVLVRLAVSTQETASKNFQRPC